MPGFRISNIKCKSELFKYRFARTVDDSICYKKWFIDRSTLPLFLDDKTLFEDETHIILIEGVVLNSKELTKKYKKESWLETVKVLVKNDEWFGELEGPISGAVYNKRNDEWVIFTGKLGERAIFFFFHNGVVIVGSQLKYLTDALHENNIKLSADEDALLRLMAYGSYIGAETSVEGIKRVYPGHYIRISGNQVDDYQYHIFDFQQTEDNKTDKEYVEMLDSSFRKAMKQILEKGIQYNYKTIIDISGGYDSRLNCYVAKALNAENVILDCYAQSNSHDFKVSNAIATELNYDYVFRPLDNASSVFGIDDNVIMLNGATTYSGITGGRDMLHMLSGYNVGLEVTGLLGDVHDGSMVTNYCDYPIDKEWYRDSTTLLEGIDFIFPEKENERFHNHINEHFWFYNRGMIYGMSSFFVRQNFIEAVTPFGNSDFIKTYLSIPWAKRVNGRLLRKWLATVYPEAGKYTNAKNGLKLNEDYKMEYVFWGKLKKQIFKFYRRAIVRKKPIGMNDFEYWYANNSKFAEYLDGYIDSNLSIIDKQSKLYLAIIKMINDGSVYNKMSVATVLSIIKNFIC